MHYPRSNETELTDEKESHAGIFYRHIAFFLSKRKITMLSREKPVVWSHFSERFNQDKILTRPKNQQGNPKKLLRQASKMNKLILLGPVKLSALYIRQSFRAYSTGAH